jgi:hypothetical protein
VLADYKTAPIEEKEKALFAFVEKVNADSPSIREEDIQALHAVGWSDLRRGDGVWPVQLLHPVGGCDRSA